MSVPPLGSPNSSQNSAETTIFGSAEESIVFNGASNRGAGSGHPGEGTLTAQGDTTNVRVDSTRLVDQRGPDAGPRTVTSSMSEKQQVKDTSVAPMDGKSSSITAIPSTASCRVCFDPGTLGDPLCAPCQCRGDMKYIHESCLKTWVSTPRFVTAQSLSQASAITSISRTTSAGIERTNRTNSGGACNANSNSTGQTLDGMVLQANTQSGASSNASASRPAATPSVPPVPSTESNSDAPVNSARRDTEAPVTVNSTTDSTTLTENPPNTIPATSSSGNASAENPQNPATSSAASSAAATTETGEKQELEVPLCEICNAPYEVPNLDLRLFNANIKSEQLSEVQIIQHQLGDRRIMNALGAAYFRKIYKMAKDRDLLILTVLGPHYQGPWQSDDDLAKPGARRNRAGSGCFGGRRSQNAAVSGTAAEPSGERPWLNDQFIHDSIIDRVCCLGAGPNLGPSSSGRSAASNSGATNSASSSSSSANPKSDRSPYIPSTDNNTNSNGDGNEVPRSRFLGCVGGRRARKKRCTNSKSSENQGAASSSDSGEYRSAVEHEVENAGKNAQESAEGKT